MFEPSRGLVEIYVDIEISSFSLCLTLLLCVAGVTIKPRGCCSGHETVAMVAKVNLRLVGRKW